MMTDDLPTEGRPMNATTSSSDEEEVDAADAFCADHVLKAAKSSSRPSVGRAGEAGAFDLDEPDASAGGEEKR